MQFTWISAFKLHSENRYLLQEVWTSKYIIPNLSVFSEESRILFQNSKFGIPRSAFNKGSCFTTTLYQKFSILNLSGKQ